MAIVNIMKEVQMLMEMNEVQMLKEIKEVLLVEENRLQPKMVKL